MLNVFMCPVRSDVSAGIALKSMEIPFPDGAEEGVQSKMACPVVSNDEDESIFRIFVFGLIDVVGDC